MNLGLVAPNVVKQDGQGRVMLELAHELIRRGHTVTIYAINVDPSAVAAGAKWVGITSVSPKALEQIVFPIMSTRAIRAEQSRQETHDLVVITGACAFPKQPYVYLACFWHESWIRAASRARIQRSLYHRLSAYLASRMEKRALSRAVAALAVSEDIARELRKVIPKGRPVDVITHGVDRNEFPRVSVGEREAARKQLGMDADDFVVCFIGEYATGRKGLGYLLEAETLSSDPRERLLIAGRGREMALKGKLAELDLQARIRVVDGRFPQKVLAASDVVAIPSVYEPFSLVALEAAASGIPVVISSVAGALAVLPPEEAVLAVDPASGVLLRKAIDRLKESPELRGQLAERAYRIAASLSWDEASKPPADRIESFGR